jgi:hypothetical protein
VRLIRELIFLFSISFLFPYFRFSPAGWLF